jgi:hypothetical protein
MAASEITHLKHPNPLKMGKLLGLDAVKPGTSRDHFNPNVFKASLAESHQGGSRRGIQRPWEVTAQPKTAAGNAYTMAQTVGADS